MFDFTGKTVLITGASMGLGEGFALGFADAGADLVLTARSADLLESVAEVSRNKGSKVTVVPGEVSPMWHGWSPARSCSIMGHGANGLNVIASGRNSRSALPPE